MAGSTLLPHPNECIVPLNFEGARVLGDQDVAQVSHWESSSAWQLQHVLHDHWLLYTAEGTSRLTVSEIVYELGAAELWLVPAGIGIHLRCRARRWKGFRISLKSSRRWEHLSGPVPRQIPAGQAHRIQPCVEGLFHEAFGPRYPDHAIMGAHFAAAIAIFLNRRLGVRWADSSWGQSLHNIWERVAGDLAGDWTVPQLAERLGVSTVHFHRLCREHYRKPPHHILVGMRMEAARAHILEGRFTLDHVATLVGYADAFALSKAFKRHFGASPDAVRKAKRDCS